MVRYGDHLQDMRCFKILNMWPWIARRFCPSRLIFFVWGNKLAVRKCTHLCLEAHDILRGFLKKGLNMSKLLETWYGCSQSNFAPCAPLATANLLANLILLTNNNQQSLSGLLTEVCAFVQFGRLSLEQHLDGELWQAWKWERLRKMGRSVCSVLLVFNWSTRWVPVGVLCCFFFNGHPALEYVYCVVWWQDHVHVGPSIWSTHLYKTRLAPENDGAFSPFWRSVSPIHWSQKRVKRHLQDKMNFVPCGTRGHQMTSGKRNSYCFFCFHRHPLAPKAMTGRFITQCLQIFNVQA